MRSCRRLTKTSSTCSYQNCGVAGLTKKSISPDRCERNCLARGRICQKHILADERRRKRTLEESGVRSQDQESGVRSQVFRMWLNGWTRLRSRRQQAAWKPLPRGFPYLLSQRIPNPESESDSIDTPRGSPVRS